MLKMAIRLSWKSSTLSRSWVFLKSLLWKSLEENLLRILFMMFVISRILLDLLSLLDMFWIWFWIEMSSM